MEAVAFHSPSGGSSLVIVEGNIAGHPANFELDTGAALPFVVLISPELAREAGAAPLREAEQQAPGAIGPARVVNRPVRLASFRIGPVRLDNVRAAVTPGLPDIGENVGARIDALIGATFLARRIIAIDYVRHTVDFEAQPGEAVRAISFTFAPRRPLPLVKVRLNGRWPFTFILDTGATTTVLKPSTAAAANIIGTGSTRVVGLGGVAEARAFRTRGELSVGQRAPRSTLWPSRMFSVRLTPLPELTLMASWGRTTLRAACSQSTSERVGSGWRTGGPQGARGRAPCLAAKRCQYVIVTATVSA